jgi:hypothetical protein
VRRLAFGLVALGLVACGGGDDAGAQGTGGTGGSAGAGGVPASVVNEQKTHATPATDVPYTGYDVTLYRTSDVLADLDVRALALAGSDLYAGTASSLEKLRSDQSGFDPVPVDGSGPVVDLALLGTGTLLVARADRVVLEPLGAGTAETRLVSGQSVSAVRAHAGDVVIGRDQGVSLLASSGATPIAALSGKAVRDLLVQGDVLYVATASGISRWDFAASAELPAWIAGDDVRALAARSDGSAILAGTALGYAEIDTTGNATEHGAGVGALPEGDVLAITERDGSVLVGHGIGASVVAGSSLKHLHGLRYLPDEQVNAVAVAADGTLFAATAGGVARLAPVSTTLADKAAALEATTDLYLRMDGFMDDEVYWSDPWDHSAPPNRSDKDNDGLWTEMQIAAWCFAYAKTGDASFYDKAKKAMDVMLLEIDVPGASFEAQGKQPGFITRSLVRSDEGAIFDAKKTEANWHLQDYEGKTYYWKDDTSSDEYTGHFFGIPIYYDLCAKPEEKANLAAHVDEVMGYLVDNGYLLIDLDGEATTFGDWTGLANAADGIGPCLAAHLPNCIESLGGEGWLNATEILGYLLAAWHVTGNDRYYQEHEKLAVDERYGEMVTPKDTTLTLTSPKNANHSDHELAILAYYTLLRYEPDATRRAGYVQALRDFYEYEKPERNALEIGLMASAIDDVDAEAAAQTLREIPSDRRKFLLDNTHRQDATLASVPDRFDDPQFESVFPYDELGELEWNGNLYGVKQGGDGRGVQGVWPYLLPYWSLRYHQALK